MPEPTMTQAAPAPAPQSTPPPTGGQNPGGNVSTSPAMNNDDPFTPPAKPAPAPSAKSQDAPKEPDATKPPDDKKDAPKGKQEVGKPLPENFRKELDRTKSELQRIADEKAALDQKVREYEARGKETSALSAQLETLAKERDDLAGQLRALKQEASPEFKAKYIDPYNKQFKRVTDEIQTFTVNGEEGERKATAEDLTMLYRLPLGSRVAKAKELFGDSYQWVIGQIDRLQEMETSYHEALETERTQYKEREQQDLAKQASRREMLAKNWQDYNKHLESAVDDYKVDPSDTEALEARKHALEVYDKRPEATNEDEYLKKNLVKSAHIRQRVGAYPVLKLQNSRLKTENEALKKQIAQLKGGEPGEVQKSASSDSPEPESDWGSDLVKSITH